KIWSRARRYDWCIALPARRSNPNPLRALRCPTTPRNSTLIKLIERAIEVRVTPALSSQAKVSFMLEIQRGTTDTLVNFGWLAADQQDDLSAIVKAFCRFAGRSLAVARNSGPDRWYTP